MDGGGARDVEIAATTRGWELNRDEDEPFLSLLSRSVSLPGNSTGLERHFRSEEVHQIEEFFSREGNQRSKSFRSLLFVHRPLSS